MWWQMFCTTPSGVLTVIAEHCAGSCPQLCRSLKLTCLFLTCRDAALPGVTRAVWWQISSCSPSKRLRMLMAVGAISESLG